MDHEQQRRGGFLLILNSPEGTQSHSGKTFCHHPKLRLIYPHIPGEMALMFREIFRKDVAAANLIRRVLALSLGVASLLISAVSATSAPSLCRPALSEMPTPPGSNSFYGTAAITANDVWAVGSHYDGVDDRLWPNISTVISGSLCLSRLPEPAPPICAVSRDRLELTSGRSATKSVVRARTKR